MIFQCSETPYYWPKNIYSPLSRLAEPILIWYLSIHLVTPQQEPCIPTTPTYLQLPQDILFQTSMPFFHLPEVAFSLLNPNHRKNSFLVNVLKSLVMKTELRIWQTHTHALHTFSHHHQHTQTHMPQTWEARQKKKFWIKSIKSLNQLIPESDSKPFSYISKKNPFLKFKMFWTRFLLVATWALINIKSLREIICVQGCGNNKLIVNQKFHMIKNWAKLMNHTSAGITQLQYNITRNKSSIIGGCH